MVNPASRERESAAQMAQQTFALTLEATRASEHLRLVETFVLKSARGEAVVQLIRRAEGNRVDPSGQATLIARDPAKARAFLADAGHPATPAIGPLARYTVPAVLHDTGLGPDRMPWREFKLQLRHGGAAADAFLKVQGGHAELTTTELFWQIAQLALGCGVAERQARPAGVSISRPELLRGGDDMRLVGGHDRLFGIDQSSSVFMWLDLAKKPRRLLNLGHTVISANAWAGHLVACGAAHETGAWRVVRVQVARPEVQVVVESSDAFTFYDAKLLLSDDGKRLAAASGGALRVYEGTAEVGAVTHTSEVAPRLWLGDALIVATPEGLMRWRGGSALEALTEPVVQRCGAYELEAFADGTLRVGTRTFVPTVEADKACVRRLMHSRPRPLGSRSLLLQSDRLVALDLETLETWVVLDGADTQPYALLAGRTLVVDQQASGRPKVVNVSDAAPG